jgi:hypothetical protein
MKNTKKQTVNVTQNEEAPIERNVLAEAIVKMSDAVRKLSRGGLTREAIVVLTQHNCRPTSQYPTRKPSMTEVRAVMDSLDELGTRFTRAS